MSGGSLVRTLALVAGAIVVGNPTAAQIPEKFENLQVFPKDIPRDTLVRIMRGFTFALGVRCEFCHVEREGAPPGGGLQNIEFKRDDKDNKKTARFMLRMVDSLNNAVLPRLAKREDPPVNLACITCHRGLAVPTTIDKVLVSTTERAGVDSAVARYRMLRNDLASGKYDFREQPVSEVARRFADQKKLDEAIALLQMNQAFYPNSVAIDFQLAETYVAKGDTAQAVARLRTVLSKNPNDRRAAAQLQRLGAQP
jgi:hypothetical protein